ncbi:MAG: nucleotide exchange factor GrpE, partial [Chroococcidiopsidaceae cyanobacterium CP_BM_ER_R8_30]|nr:nucleotide exchange factor GrpE [Chroococcidiopsidaceae cyanobacterium CP_BM_ER_R8_30]
KLLQTSQNTLQQAFAALQTEKEYLQQQLEISRKQGMAQTDQIALWRELLTVLDALDQACAHWQEQIDALAPSPLPPQSQPFWQRFLQQLFGTQPDSTVPVASTSLREVLISHQQGVDLIRRSFLDLLRQRQVVPIAAQGRSFNPQTMYAVGRQESASVPENTVIQEVVRGYLWGEQVLREAQVIVAAKQG